MADDINADNEGSENQISFKAIGEWNVSDLEIFANSINKIYDIFLAIDIKDGIDKRNNRLRENELEKYLKFLGRYDEYSYHVFKKFEEDFHHFGKKRSSFLPYIVPPFYYPIQKDLVGSTSKAFEIFQNIGQYSTNGQRLRVHQIVIRSPGGFTFIGVGEIIKELRELIKDLSYRNKAERINEELKIVEKVLEIEQRYGVKIAKALNDEIKIIRSLESEGKLGNLAENINFKPEC